MQENCPGQENVLSVEELFLSKQESYTEAQQRSQEENKPFAKTEFFRMEKLGVYRFRILPLPPKPDGTVERKGYEYPVRQMLLNIEKPVTGNKPTYMYVNVPKTTDAGYSIDIIDTYRKLAVQRAKENGDEKLAEKISEGAFGGGLKYSFGHAMYVYDLNERAKGLQLLTLSHSQYKDLEERKLKLWQKKLAKSPTYPCPVSSVYDAYPVEIEKKKNGSKTEYVITIDNESDVDPLSTKELSDLMAASQIPEIIYRYTRYQLEATIVFLQQCDEKYGMDILNTNEMSEVIATLRDELPKEDTSTFSFDKRTRDSKDAKENPSNGITFDNLQQRYDELQEKGLTDKTEEGQELRSQIRTYIEQEKLLIRVTRSTTNSVLLDQIEELIYGSTRNATEQEDEVDDLPF